MTLKMNVFKKIYFMALDFFVFLSPSLNKYNSDIACLSSKEGAFK